MNREEMDTAGGGKGEGGLRPANLGERIIQFRTVKCSRTLKLDGIAILARANGRPATRFRLWFIAYTFVDFLWEFRQWKCFRHDVFNVRSCSNIHFASFLQIFHRRTSIASTMAKFTIIADGLRKHKRTGNNIYVGYKEKILCSLIVEYLSNLKLFLLYWKLKVLQKHFACNFFRPFKFSFTLCF